MSSDEHIDIISRERIESIKEEINYLSCRIDEYSKGAMKKALGDIQTATNLSQLKEIVDHLNKVVLTGNGGYKSLRSNVDFLNERVDKLKIDVKELENKINGIKRDDSSIRVAALNSNDNNWKTTALLIGTILTSVTALIIALIQR